jgi:hypothetical protein
VVHGVPVPCVDINARVGIRAIFDCMAWEHLASGTCDITDSRAFLHKEFFCVTDASCLPVASDIGLSVTPEPMRLLMPVDQSGKNMSLFDSSPISLSEKVGCDKITAMQLLIACVTSLAQSS